MTSETDNEAQNPRKGVALHYNDLRASGPRISGRPDKKLSKRAWGDILALGNMVVSPRADLPTPLGVTGIVETDHGGVGTPEEEIGETIDARASPSNP